jgi:8-hydroxy-5-deazaflavin:NADPH oxidoreductase
MGGKLGTLFARAGHEVVFSYARHQEKLKRHAKGAGGNARTGTPRQAAQDADAVLLAVLGYASTTCCVRPATCPPR